MSQCLIYFVKSMKGKIFNIQVPVLLIITRIKIVMATMKNDYKNGYFPNLIIMRDFYDENVKRFTKFNIRALEYMVLNTRVHK